MNHGGGWICQKFLRSDGRLDKKNICTVITSVFFFIEKFDLFIQKTTMFLCGVLIKSSSNVKSIIKLRNKAGALRRCQISW